MDYSLPENSWILYRETVEKADNALKIILNNNPMGPLLNQFIHMLVFQQGICAARWIINNRELVIRINAVNSFTKNEFDELASEVKASVSRLAGK